MSNKRVVEGDCVEKIGTGADPSYAFFLCLCRKLAAMIICLMSL